MGSLPIAMSKLPQGTDFGLTCRLRQVGIDGNGRLLGERKVCLAMKGDPLWQVPFGLAVSSSRNPVRDDHLEVFTVVHCPLRDMATNFWRI